MRGQRHVRRMAPWLSALSEGDLGRVRAALMRWHLRRCAGCQQALQELSAQRDLLRAALGPLEAPPLVGDGWRALAARLDGPLPPRTSAPVRRLRLAAGFALAGISAAALALYLQAPVRDLFLPMPSDDAMIGAAEAEFRAAELSYQRAIEDLERRMERARAGLDPTRGDGHRQALYRLHAQTERERTAARLRPADLAAQEGLYRAYQAQISYLQDSLREASYAATEEALK